VSAGEAYVGSRDRRFVAISRGGALSDADHRLLAVWAADCAQHVLGNFSAVRPHDDRPSLAIDAARAWSRGEISMTQAREAAYAAHDAARESSGAASEAARSAGHAAATAHMADHELGAAAYAIRSARASAVPDRRDEAGRGECLWQCEHLPEVIRELVLDDERLRNRKFWSVFDCGPES